MILNSCKEVAGGESCDTHGCVLLATSTVNQQHRVHGNTGCAGNEVASALPGSNGEVQQLPQRASEAAVAPAAEPAPLAWLPTTLAAVALRLQALDAAAIYADCSQPARDTLLVCFCCWPVQCAEDVL